MSKVAEDDGQEQRAGGSLLKRVLIFVIAPAVIAGFFSIAPKLYDEFTKPVARLSYSVLSGPSHPAGSGFRRILSVVVENAGKTPTTDVRLQLAAPKGQFENVIAEKTALSPEIVQGEGEVRASVARMLPGDRLTISAMVLVDNADRSLGIDLRSTEVRGEVKDRPKEEQDQRELWLAGAVTSGASVAVMASLFLTYRRFLGRLTQRSALSDKDDFVSLVLGLSGAATYDRLLLGRPRVTYLRAANALLIGGLTDPRARPKCIAGLRSLMLVDDMFQSSRDVIRSNLSRLGYDYTESGYTTALNHARTLSTAARRKEALDLFQEVLPEGNPAGSQRVSGSGP